MKTVLVNRKDHPCNPVLVNECDKLEGDVVVGEEKKEEKKVEKPAPRRSRK